jgi:hypothetical protein
LECIRLHNDTARAAFAASLRDFAHALESVRGESALLTSSAITYELGRELARELWAFELAPEGAPLAAAVAAEFAS